MRTSASSRRLSSASFRFQTLSWLSPATAERLGLTEREETVDPAYYGDIRGEAVWDTFTLWTMPLAGALVLLESDAWPYLALVGGGMYLYFGGRGILTRSAIRRRGMRVGDPETVKTAYVALTIWGLLGAIAVIAGTAQLAT